VDVVWDYRLAARKGCIEFLQKKCPKDKLEMAMDMLSRNGYRHGGLLDKLRALPPNDGSDWTLDERHRFHILVDKFRHDLKKVAIELGKPVVQCVIFHYGLGQKRQTRGSRILSLQPTDLLKTSSSHNGGYTEKRITRSNDSLTQKGLVQENALVGSDNVLGGGKETRRSRTSSHEPTILESFPCAIDNDFEKKKVNPRSKSMPAQPTVLENVFACHDTDRPIHGRGSRRIRSLPLQTPTPQTSSIAPSNNQRQTRQLSRRNNTILPASDAREFALDQNDFQPKSGQERQTRKRTALSQSQQLSNTEKFSANTSDSDYEPGPEREARRSRLSCYQYPSHHQPQFMRNSSSDSGKVTFDQNDSQVPLRNDEVILERTLFPLKATHQPSDSEKVKRTREKECKILGSPHVSFFHNDKWGFYLNELKDFKKEYGHCLVPKEFPLNPALSRWVYKVRA
jgi:hypothetical protein